MKRAAGCYPSLCFLLPFPLSSHYFLEVLWLDLQLLIAAATTPPPPVQIHHVPIPRVIELRRHPGPAVQVVPARADDLDSLLEERTLNADLLFESVQVRCCVIDSLCRSQRVEPPGFPVALGDASAELITCG